MHIRILISTLAALSLFTVGCDSDGDADDDAGITPDGGATLSIVGGTCTSDAQCVAGFTCADLDLGGHCEKDCTADADCGPYGVCTTDTGGVGGTCYRACTATSDCRSDRRCVGGVAPRLFCDPPSAAGGQCMADTDCSATFMCADLDLGGHCEKDCTADAECGEGGICTADTGGVGGTCYHACTLDTDCRTGRVCVGGVAPRLFCDPPPTP